MEFNLVHPSTIIQFIGMSVWFVISVIIAFILPGRLFLNKFVPRESFVKKSVLFMAFGLVLWFVQALLFGYLSIRFATYLYLGFCIVLTLRERTSIVRAIKTFIHTYKFPSILLVIVFAIGIFGQTGKLFWGGFIFPNGIHNFVDDMGWHISLTSQLVKRVPPFEPGFTGLLLRNYYYLADLAPAEMVRVFHLPLPATEFIFMYVFQSFLLGALLYILAAKIHLSRAGQIFLVYLGYFSSDIIYLLTFITRRVFEFTVHPLEDGTMFLENPPRAMSFLLTILGIILLQQWLEKPKKLLGLYTAVTFGLVMGAKAHTGIMVLMGLAGLGLYFILKRQWNMLYVPLLALGTSLLVYLPVNSGFGGPVYAPFEMSRMFTVQPLLNISWLELRRRVYLDYSNTIRAFQMDSIMLGIFLICQFGIKNIGWFAIFLVRKTIQIPLIIFFYAALVGTFFFGTFYIQPIEYANIFNSYLAGGLILAILTAVVVDRIFRNKSTGITMLVILVIGVATIPRNVSKYVQFYYQFQQEWNKGISSGEAEAMNYIKNHTPSSDVLLVVNGNGSMDSVQPYVTAYTMRDALFSGQIALKTNKIPYQGREKEVTELLTGDSREKKIQIIEKYNLRLLYYYGDVPLPDALSGLPFKLFFRNNSITVFRYE